MAKQTQVRALTYEGGDISAAPLFGECKMPVMNLVGQCTNQVMRNMPVYFGTIYGEVTQPVITGQSYEVTVSEDECMGGMIETDAEGCEWKYPVQVEIDLCTKKNKWKELWKKFCRDRGVASSCPPPFRGDAIDASNSMSQPFVQYCFKAHTSSYQSYMQSIVFAGDVANPLEVQGVYTQIDNGWEAVGDDCPIYNLGTEIDWAAATAGAVDCDGVDIAGQAGATMTADVTIWGQTIGAGMGLGELLAAFMDGADDYIDALGGDAVWEIHYPKGMKNCLIGAVSCMRVCCNSDLDVSETLDRYANLRRQNIIDLYPYRDEQIALLQNPDLEDGCIRFGVREVGGCNTYGLLMEPVGEYFEEINDMFGGAGFVGGLPVGADDGLISELGEEMGARFEALGFGTSIVKEGSKCLTACTTSCFTPLAFHRCLWLKICGLTCSSIQKPVNSADIGEKKAAEAKG